MIIVALIILPSKIEDLITLWIERKNSARSYSAHWSTIKHIVVCIEHLQHDFLLNFLKEFYGHRKNQVCFLTLISRDPFRYKNSLLKSINTVLLSTSECNLQLKQLLNSPIWHGRVYYIYGSAMRNADLMRAE